MATTVYGREIGFGEFRVDWPLVICEFLHMGSNKSEIRISLVIITKSYRTTGVFWHDNRLFSHAAICILFWAAHSPQ